MVERLRQGRRRYSTFLWKFHSFVCEDYSVNRQFEELEYDYLIYFPSSTSTCRRSKIVLHSRTRFVFQLVCLVMFFCCFYDPLSPRAPPSGVSGNCRLYKEEPGRKVEQKFDAKTQSFRPNGKWQTKRMVYCLESLWQTNGKVGRGLFIKCVPMLFSLKWSVFFERIKWLFLRMIFAAKPVITGCFSSQIAK